MHFVEGNNNAIDATNMLVYIARGTENTAVRTEAGLYGLQRYPQVAVTTLLILSLIIVVVKFMNLKMFTAVLLLLLYTASSSIVSPFIAKLNDRQPTSYTTGCGGTLIYRFSTDCLT